MWLRVVSVVPALIFAVADPAHATGGVTCRTARPRPIVVSIGFGHAPGAPLLKDATSLLDNGRNIPVIAPQWWLDNTELRLLLANPSATRRELILKARRKGVFYDGFIWRGGQRRWVRCRDS